MAITFPEFTYLTLPAAPKWGSTTCCWFRLPSTIYSGGGVGLLSFGTADGYGACVVTQNLATDQFTLRVLDGSFRNIGCSYIKPDTWYFLALTVSATGTATFHVGMAGRAGILSSFDSYQTPTQTGQRVFGALGDGSYSDYGSVCWIKAWSAELTKSELIAEMSGSALVRTANAFACCPIPNVSTLTDTSGQGHPISMVNGGAASTIADVEPVTTVTLPTLTTNLVVACVGDSRTFGTNGGGTTWPGTLQTLRTGDVIVNDGVSGMGAQGDYLRIQETVLPRWTSGGGTNTRVCLLHNGINDIANGVSLNRILGNMLSSIDLLLTHGSNVYPAFMSELADGVSAYNTIEQQLSTELASICTTLGIKYVDFRTNSDLMNPVSSAYGGVGGDGRHLVATGYALMGNLVDAAIDSWYSSVGSVVTGSGAITGSSSVSGVGSSAVRGATSVAGAASVSGVGASRYVASSTISGSSSVVGIGARLSRGSGAVSGSSSVSTAGSSRAISLGAINGTSSLTGVGSSRYNASGSIAGTSTVTGAASSRCLATGTATGSCIVTGSGETGAINSGFGTVTGSSTVSGVGQSSVRMSGAITGSSSVAGFGTSRSVGTSTVTGAASVSGAGASTCRASGAITGSCVVTGIGSGTADGSGIGTVIGASSAVGVGSSRSLSSGTSSGTASVTGAAQSRAIGTGTASGSASVVGSGESAAVVAGFGTITGSSTVTGQAKAIIYAFGNIAGQGLAMAAGFSLVMATALSESSSTIATSGASTCIATGTASGVAIVIGSAGSRAETGTISVQFSNACSIELVTGQSCSMALEIFP